MFLPTERVRKSFGYISSLGILLMSFYVIYSSFDAPATHYLIADSPLNEAMLAIEALIALYIIFRSARCGKALPIVLVLLQSACVIWSELGYPAAQASGNSLFLDSLSVIMVSIIGIIGSLICVYSFGYMGNYHARNRELKDRRGVFYYVMFAFLSAMFGLVLSDSLKWVYFFWEVTTLCSFILIGYTRTNDSIKNSFNALTMNLLGGIAFAFAILYLSSLAEPNLTIDGILRANKAIVLVPVVLVGFAALTKSAQLPFSSWLVGAMVAPTPVSALLHSSTMVKAGVYLLVRFAPVFEGTVSGTMLSLLGGVTFLVTSMISVSQKNAKKVLAYSTIANLGLIVACAGVGTYEAVWAAVLLIIFHALAKSLMFLAVGTVEQKISSKDIEDMEGLIIRMPKISVMMIIGIAGMFLAPFGMLISKWATLKAFIDSNPVLVGIVAFGSGVTVFFWSKWLGKIIVVNRAYKQVEGSISAEEWTALYSLMMLTIGICVLFPLVSQHFVEPYVYQVYGRTTHLSQDNLMIMLFMLAVILLTPFCLLYYKGERRHISPYMGGRTVADSKFLGTFGIRREMSLKNYYLESVFGEAKLMKLALPLCIMLIAAMLIFSMTGVAL
ncbi:MAG: proton-conducting transporter membrane subunit [Candidatus Altiarchaeota archaeon]